MNNNTNAAIDNFEKNVIRLIRDIQAGQLNGITPADCGPYADIMSEAVRAFEQGGIGVAMRVIATSQELLRLASVGDTAVSPTFSHNETWAESSTVLNALDRAEVGDAELLASLYTDRLAYDHSEREWYVWNGNHWELDRRRQVWNLVPNALAAQYLHTAATVSQAQPTNDTDDNADSKELVDRFLKRAGGLRYRNRIGNVLDHASKLPGFALSGDEWGLHPMLLAVANGIIDLTTGTLRSGQPADYVRNASPVMWQGLDTPAPRWEKFLQEIFTCDAELIGFIQRLFGYAITGQVVEHILPILWGQGRNGKGTLIEIISSILGDLAAPVPKDVLLASRHDDPGSPSPHIYALRPLRIAWVSEPREGSELNAAQVKWLTGGDTLTARRLHCNPVTFRPRHTLFLLTNPRPRADPTDYALWKRLLLIPFTESFVDDLQDDNEHLADPHLQDKLSAESPGILAWLVRGCLQWQQQGLNPPKQVRLATESYQHDEDNITLFIEEYCVIDNTATIRASMLYLAYQEWAEKHRLRPVSQTAFGKLLGRKFDRKISAGVHYLGIRLRQNDD